MIAELFDFIANEGFGEWARRYDLEFASAAEFRQRYLIRALLKRG